MRKMELIKKVTKNNTVNKLKYYRHIIRGFFGNLAGKRYNSVLKDRKQDVFILGTGPSARKAWDNVEKLSKKSNTDFIIFNEAIWQLYEKISILKPSVIVLWDPVFFKKKEDNKGQIYEISKTKDLTMEKLNLVDWHMSVVIPSQYNLTIPNKNIKVLKMQGVVNQAPEIKNKYKYYDKNYLIPAGNNVLQIALYFAVMNGYREVGFIGGEFSFWKDTYIDERDKKTKVRVPHCYEKEEELFAIWTLEEDGDMYCKNKTGPLPAFLRRTADSMDGFYYIHEYADWKRIKIINYSEGTMLEAFSMKKFSEYIGG